MENYAVICFCDDEAKHISRFATPEMAAAACEGIDMCNDDKHFGVVYDIANRCIIEPCAEDFGDEFQALARAVDDAMADMLVGEKVL